MSIPNMLWDLNETEKAIKDTVHKFAAEVLRPSGIALDKLRPDEAIDGDSIFWDVYKQYLVLGLNESGDELTPIENARIQTIVSEELGWGDSGFAIAFGAGNFPSTLAAGTGDEELMALFPQGKLGCWAITEPDHGSDMIDFNDQIMKTGSSHGKPNCIARADGNVYVINGQKSAWVSNAMSDEAAALFTDVEMSGGSEGGGECGGLGV